MQPNASSPSSGASARKGKTRVAVVGAGVIAEFHLDALSNYDHIELVAICDPDEARAQSYADRYKAPNTVTSLDGLPNLGVEVVHLCVPPDLHVRLTRQALELGLGVFVEKPFALDTPDAEALAALAEEHDLPLAVNHNYVYHPSFQRMLDRIEEGEIGRVEHVQVTLSVPLRQLDAADYTHWMFRTPRNIVFEQAVHPLSMVHHLLGEVKTLQTDILGSKELLPGQVFHDRWAISATAERGTAQLYLAFGQPFTRTTIQVLGSDGSLEADLFHDGLAGERKSKWLDFYNSYKAGAQRAKELKKDSRRVLMNWSRFTLGIGKRKDAFFVSMQSSIHAFYDALRAGRPLPGGARSAAAVTRWADLIGEAAAPAMPAAETFPEPGEARAGEILVLGGTGFIGRRVVTRLVDAEEPVTCIVRRTHSLPTQVTEPAYRGDVRMFKASLSDAEALAPALKGVKTIIHLATAGGDTWEQVQKSMVEGSVQFLEQAAAAGVERMVYVSSIAALYTGKDSAENVIEDSWDTDPEPEKRPAYSRGKAATEAALREAAKRTGIELIVTRPGVVLGDGTPMQHSGLGLWARDNHCVGWGLGADHLPLVLADDVADALVSAARYEGDDLNDQVLNLCANPKLTATDMLDELRKATGRDVQFHPRSLWLSQAMEIGKWLVKKAGGRKDAAFPSYRDLKSRGLATPFSSNLARTKLGWQPTEDRKAFIREAVRIYAPETAAPGPKPSREGAGAPPLRCPADREG